MLKGISIFWISAVATVFIIPSYAQDLEQHTVPGRKNRVEQLQKPYVILISADGFRYDYVDKYNAPNLKKIRQAGVYATGMKPSFPSVTFPNHYTVATGMYPSHHGLVYNEFYDRNRKETYAMYKRKAVEDGSWYGGVPLWVLAEQQGMMSASYHFVGTEAPIQGTYPSYWFTFSEKTELDLRIRQVVDWLNLPPEVRPHFITFYMSYADHAGHDYGPDASQTRDAVMKVDAAVGKLNDELSKLGLPINFIFVSDHGMSLVDTTFRMDLASGIDTSRFIVRGGSTTLHLYARDPRYVAGQYEALRKGAVHYRVYLRKNLPPAWHYSSADDYYNRIGDLVLVPVFPKVFSTGKRKIIPGAHGFDPNIRDMHASFIAWGPAFRKSYRIPVFENIHVYPLVCRILGLKYTHKIDGRPEVLQSLLK